jgi:hypothetical protein
MAHALYYQTSQLSNQTACDGITLSEVAAESCGDFCTDGNTFQIRKPGVYLVTYVINIPSTMAVNTTFALQVNRQNVASTVRPVVKVATDSTLSITAQAILAVSTPVTLRIASSSLITVTGAATETMASLSIIQLTQC